MAWLKSTGEPNDDADADRDRLTQLTQIVDLGVQQFQKVGLALEEIRDRQLYRLTHSSFAEFCRERWQMSDRHARHLIEAAAICRELGTDGPLPENERQARALKALPPEQRSSALEEAARAGVSLASVVRSKQPTTKKIKIKPVRIRVPGATVIVEPNSRFQGIDQTLRWAIDRVDVPKAA